MRIKIVYQSLPKLLCQVLKANYNNHTMHKNSTIQKELTNMSKLNSQKNFFNDWEKKFKCF